MPDFRVRFVGDLGNLAAFDRAIRNSAVESTRQLEAANKRVASSAGFGSVLGPLSSTNEKAGRYVSNQKTIVDSYNRTFRQVGDIVRKSVAGYEAVLQNGKYEIKPIFNESYLGKFNKAIGDLDRYERAIKRVAAVEKQIDATRLATATRSVDYRNRAIEALIQKDYAQGELDREILRAAPSVSSAPYVDLIRAEQRKLLDLRAGTRIYNPTPTRFAAFPDESLPTLNQVSEAIRATKASLKVPGISSADRAALKAELAALQNLLASAPANIAQGAKHIRKSIADYRKGIAAEVAPLQAEVARLDAALAKLEALDAKNIRAGARAESRLRGGKNAAKYAEIEAATKAIPPIDTNLASALAQSPDLRKKLLASGLGEGAKYGTKDFQAALAAQTASVNQFTTDISKGITRVSGQWIPQTGKMKGVTQEFTVELDKNNKVVGRWGGQLAGTGQALNQTVRNFQKVVQWTVATTAVFGALGVVIGSLNTINELNTNLERLSITAQTSASETEFLFKGLAQIGYETATPLKEIVKIADDVALATRSANQSGEEWRQGILDLTRAVGIFTNLTGTDTVQAADVLNSTFKQLDIAPSGLIGILNKVTAVAGGQSTAINEIVTALGTVAEAGKVAGLSIDEQIASVQVLGQVTNKSAADVATAFKNLFGSVDSVGAIKALQKFGLSVRDEEGNLKGFLDIYREIAQAREQGIIPESEFKGVLKGISGGPRRAPDAAALIANIDLIDQAIAKSAQASNEALIANAKILSTNQAKITQFQNAFDTAVFERFGAAVENLTDIITKFGTVALRVFGGINPQIVELLIQIGLLITAGKLLGSVWGRVVAPAFSSSTAAIKSSAAGVVDYTAQTATLSKVAGKGSIIKGIKPFAPDADFLKYPSPVSSHSPFAPVTIARLYDKYPGALPTSLIPVTGSEVKSKFGIKGEGDLLGAYTNKGNILIDKNLVGRELTRTITHEFGHHIRQQIRSQGLGAQFRLLLSDLRLPAVTKYARTNKDEAWAELFSLRETPGTRALTSKELAAARRMDNLISRYVPSPSPSFYSGGNGQISQTAFPLLTLKSNQVKVDAQGGITQIRVPAGYIDPKTGLRAVDPKTGRGIGGQFRSPEFFGIDTGYQTPPNRFKNYISSLGKGGKIGLAGLGIGAAAGAKALVTGEGVGDVGGLLTIGGSIATMIPGLQVAGIATLALGTAMQFLGNSTKEVTKSSAELAQEIFGIIQGMTAAQSDVALYTQQQREAGRAIDDLQAKERLGPLTADEQASLTAQTTKYVDAVVALAGANTAAAASFDELTKKIPTLSSQYEDFINLVNDKKLTIDSTEIQKLSQQLAKEILTASGQLIYTPENIEDTKISPEFREVPFSGSTVVTSRRGRQQVPSPLFDLEELVTAPQKLLDIFDTQTGKLKQGLAVPANAEAFGFITDALKQFPELIEKGTININEEQLTKLVQAVQELTGQQSSYFETQASLFARNANVQALGAIGVLKGEDLENAQLRLTLGDALSKRQKNADTVGSYQALVESGYTDAGQTSTAGVNKQEVQDLINSLTQTTSGGINFAGLTKQSLTDVATILLQTTNGLNGVGTAFDDLKAKGEAALNEGIITQLEAVGVPVELLIALFGEAAVAASDLGEELELAFDAAQASALDKFASRNLQLLIAENSGDFKDNAAGLATLRAQSEAAYQAETQLLSAVKALSKEGYVVLQAELSKVVGLENLQNASQDELAGKLIDSAIAAGVNAEGLKLIQTELAKVFGLVEAIPTYKQVMIDIITRHSEGGKTGRGGKSARDIELYNLAKQAEQDAIKAGTDPSVLIKKIIDNIQGALDAGTGSQLGQLPDKAPKGPTAPYNKPGLLDVPEDLLKQPNFRDLINQAVENARKLQGTFPGEVKENKDDIVALLNGTQKLLQTRGIGEEYLRRALDELTEQVKKQNEFLTKADTIRRIRVGGADFSSIANVPVNTKTGVSLGGPQGPINVSLNLNGTVLTPAQFSQFADMIAAAIKRQIAA